MRQPRSLIRRPLFLALIVGLALLVGLPSFATRGFRASSDAVQGIAQVLRCGRIGEVEGVSPGSDLFRVDIDLKDYPKAVCNDGSGATMFVRRFAKKRDKNKWIIFLLGGGSCSSAVSCAERWCSINTNYGANKMSTAFLRDQGVTGSIEAKGIFLRDASINNFADWNQVFVYYCSSDDWSGSAGDVRLSATDAEGHLLDYSINFRGADIVEAVVATLQREPDGEAVAYLEAGEQMVLPDLDKAELVLFTGSSAGGNGVKNNADRVGELIRKTNKSCKKSNECPLVYLGVIDANYPPSYKTLNLPQSDFCTGPASLCSYDSYYSYRWSRVEIDTYSSRGDESCVEWHKNNMPGTEWQCADPQHVVDNHLTTPLFIRMDLQDQTILNSYLDLNLTTANEFGQLTHDQLLSVVSLDTFAEEGSIRSGGARIRTPGVFGPQCTQHYGLSVSKPFFVVSISSSGQTQSFHNALWDWVQGMQPQFVRPFAGPGPAPNCP